MAGLQPGLNVHSKETVEANLYKSDSMQWNVSYGPPIRTFDIGISLGIQKQICDHLYVTLAGFQSIFTVLQPETTPNATLRNLNVMAGFRYNIFQKSGD